MARLLIKGYVIDEAKLSSLSRSVKPSSAILHSYFLVNLHDFLKVCNILIMNLRFLAAMGSKSSSVMSSCSAGMRPERDTRDKVLNSSSANVTGLKLALVSSFPKESTERTISENLRLGLMSLPTHQTLYGCDVLLKAFLLVNTCEISCRIHRAWLYASLVLFVSEAS